jgi:putative radical SAM enzyme (TIGR03279 family)
MALFQEIDLTTYAGGQIVAIEPGSVADDIGLQPGDELLAINDSRVEDVIDVRYYSAEESLELLVRRGEEYLLFEAERDYNQTLGLEFAHPTFDTDIRRCNNLCEFCFVLQMAPRFRRTLYIKDDDYRYSFLFGHFVTLTNLSDHDWWRIETMRLSPLYVSVHVTDLEKRRQYLRNKTAPDVLEQIRWLGERGIEVHTQLVITPEWNDGEWMERSIRELSALWPTVQSISVVPVGLTKQHKYGMRPHTAAEAAATLAYLEELQQIYLEKFDVRFLYPTDEWYLVAGREVPTLEAYDGQELQENGLGMVRGFLDEWEGVKEEIGDWRLEIEESPQSPISNLQSLTLVTATLFAPVLQQAAAEFAALTGLSVTVLPVVNGRLGETITVAGLLMGSDVVEQLLQAGVGDLVVLPRVMFDHPDVIALDDISPQDVANRLKRPLALADTMGDVWDAVIGASQVMFFPDDKPQGTISLKVLGDAENDTHFS